MSSSSAQLRKIKKPLIERRRRERINDSLNQLKNLVLEATNKDESRYSKMEKADILEMTVAYLQVTHSRRRPGLDMSPCSGVDRYTAGFRECAVHVGQYLLDAGVSFSAVHERLMSHLDKTLQAVVDVSGCGRLPAAGFESTDDVSTEKVSRTGDCDTTGRCSPDTDDDDCGSMSAGAVSGVDDVVRRQYNARCGTTVTAGVQQLTDTTATTSSTTTTYRQPLHPSTLAGSPRSADEFPLFPPNIATTVDDDYTSAVPSGVVDHIQNDAVVAHDVKHEVRDVSCITSSLSKLLPVNSIDTITDDSSNVWQPWR